MRFIKEKNRDQMMFSTMEIQIEQGNPVQRVDAFVGCIDRSSSVRIRPIKNIRNLATCRNQEEGLSIEFTQDEVKADGLVDNQKNAALSA